MQNCGICFANDFIHPEGTPSFCIYHSAFIILLTKASFYFVEDFVCQSAVLVQHGVGLAVQLLGDFPVFQGLGVDEHVQGSGLQSGLAAHSAAAGIGNSQPGALGGKHSHAVNGLAAH